MGNQWAAAALPPSDPTRGTRGGPTRIDRWSWRRCGDSTPNYACMRETRPAPATPGGDSRPPIRAPASALRRARPPPSDGGRAPHTALRAPPWAFTQHIVSTNVLSSPGGIGILAQSPTARPEGKEGDARVGPPPHTSHRPRSWPGLPACPPLTSSTLHRQPAGVAFLPPTRPPGRMHRGPCRPR